MASILPPLYCFIVWMCLSRILCKNGCCIWTFGCCSGSATSWATSSARTMGVVSADQDLVPSWFVYSVTTTVVLQVFVCGVVALGCRLRDSRFGRCCIFCDWAAGSNAEGAGGGVNGGYLARKACPLEPSRWVTSPFGDSWRIFQLRSPLCRAWDAWSSLSTTEPNVRRTSFDLCFASVVASKIELKVSSVVAEGSGVVIDTGRCCEKIEARLKSVTKVRYPQLS